MKSKNKYERFPPVCVILYGLAAVSLILYVIMMNSAAFAEITEREGLILDFF